MNKEKKTTKRFNKRTNRAMDKLTPKEVEDTVLDDFGFKKSPVDIDEYLIDICSKSLPSFSKAEISEEILSNLDSYVSRLEDKQRELEKSGRFPPFKVYPDRGILVGFSHVKRSDSKRKERIREIAPLHSDVLSSLRDITPDQLESLCAKTMALIGSRHAHKTKRTSDGGIDFFSRLSLSGNSGGFFDISDFESDFKVSIVGQAKAYSSGNSVSTNEIRELVGSFAMFDFAKTTGLDHPSDIRSEHRLCDPAIPVFMTTGDYTRDSVREAEKYGVILKDGSQIATFLCLREVGFTEIGNSINFELSLMEEWLEQ